MATAVSQFTSIVILIFFSVKNIETTPYNLYLFDSPKRGDPFSNQDKPS